MLAHTGKPKGAASIGSAPKPSHTRTIVADRGQGRVMVLLGGVGDE